MDWNQHYDRLIATERSAIRASKWLIGSILVLAAGCALPALLDLTWLPESARNLLWQTAAAAGGLFEAKLWRDIVESKRIIDNHESRKALLEGKRESAPEEFAQLEKLAVQQLFGGGA